MIRNLFLFLTTISFIVEIKSQNFNQTFEVEMDFNGIEKIVETRSNEWVSTIYKRGDENTPQLMSMITVTETEESLNADILALKNSEYYVKNAHLISEWTDSSKSVLIGNVLRLSDSTEVVASVEVIDNTMYIIEHFSYPFVLGKFQFVGGYFEDNDDQITFYTGSPDSSANTVRFYKMNQAQEILSMDSMLVSSSFQPSEILKFEENILMADRNGNVFELEYTDSSFLSLKEQFWTGYNLIDSVLSPLDTMPFFDINRIIRTSEDNILAFGEIDVDRNYKKSGFDYDSEVRIAKFKSDFELKKEVFFGKIDTVVPGIVYKYYDEFVLGNMFHSDSENNIYFSSTSNLGSFSHIYWNEPTWLNVFKLDEDLNKIWHYEYTDSVDSSRILNYAMLPLSDGGVILFSYKYNYKSLPENGLDLHVLRLKADGTPYTLSVPIIEASKSSITLYPNPATNRFSISGLPDDMQSIDLIDINGRTVRSYGERQESYAVEGLPAGVYVVRLRTQRGFETLRLIIGE